MKAVFMEIPHYQAYELQILKWTGSSYHVHCESCHCITILLGLIVDLMALGHIEIKQNFGPCVLHDI